MKRIFPIFALFLAATVHAEEADPVIWAHLVGENFGKVDTNIVVTVKKQKVFHFHSDSEGGGTWYDAFISQKGGIVTILERDSISNPCKGGDKVETKESIHRLSGDKITGETIKLRNGNRVTLKIDETNKNADTQSSEEPDIVHLKAGGETTLNGVAVDIAQLSEKFTRSSVIISPDKSVPHKTVSAVLNEVAEAGIKKVAFVTEATSATSQYDQAIRKAILSVVDCTNPEILISGKNVADEGHEEYFREQGKLAYSFEKVMLGPDVVGYRSDLIPCGQGWGGHRHARLFELQNKQLVLVFELAGPFLFVEDSNPENGRFQLWHWVGDDPLTAKPQYYTFKNGQYVKDTKPSVSTDNG